MPLPVLQARVERWVAHTRAHPRSTDHQRSSPQSCGGYPVDATRIASGCLPALLDAAAGAPRHVGGRSFARMFEEPTPRHSRRDSCCQSVVGRDSVGRLPGAHHASRVVVCRSAVPHIARRLRAILERELAIAGYDACDSFELSSTPLAFCQGEFDCWVKTPDAAVQRDAEQAIVQAVP